MSPGYEADRRSHEHSQCAGAAIYRANIGVSEMMPPSLLKLEMNTELVFASHAELCAYHYQEPLQTVQSFFDHNPAWKFLIHELNRPGCEITQTPRP